MAQLPPKLIVGLGNPGPEYSETRHNAGFWFCERLAREWGLGFNRESRFHGLVASSRTEGVQLLMPQTFMNRSGQAVGALARFYRIQPAEILVVHDELDIPPGQLRLKFGGGAGGTTASRTSPLTAERPTTGGCASALAIPAIATRS